jgi:hypothetical protein
MGKDPRVRIRVSFQYSACSPVLGAWAETGLRPINRVSDPEKLCFLTGN